MTAPFKHDRLTADWTLVVFLLLWRMILLIIYILILTPQYYYYYTIYFITYLTCCGRHDDVLFVWILMWSIRLNKKKQHRGHHEIEIIRNANFKNSEDHSSLSMSFEMWLVRKSFFFLNRFVRILWVCWPDRTLCLNTNCYVNRYYVSYNCFEYSDNGPHNNGFYKCWLINAKC